MFEIITSKQFRKDLKKVKLQPHAFSLTSKVLQYLQKGGVDSVPVSLLPHKLKGRFSGYWECHIKPDLLLIWLQISKSNWSV